MHKDLNKILSRHSYYKDYRLALADNNRLVAAECNKVVDKALLEIAVNKDLERLVEHNLVVDNNNLERL